MASNNSLSPIPAPGGLSCCPFYDCCCVVVDSLFIFSTIVCMVIVFSPSFVVQYLESILVMQASRWGTEIWLLYFNSLLDVMRL